METKFGWKISHLCSWCCAYLHAELIKSSLVELTWLPRVGFQGNMKYLNDCQKLLMTVCTEIIVHKRQTLLHHDVLTPCFKMVALFLSLLCHVAVVFTLINHISTSLQSHSSSSAGAALNLLKVYI